MLFCPSEQTVTASKPPTKIVESTSSTNINRSASPHVLLTDSDLPTLLRELTKLASEWKNIGVLLGIQTGLLNNIKSDELSTVGRLCVMLETWLKQVDPQPTWNDICEVVENFDPYHAQHLRQKYLS